MVNVVLGVTGSVAGIKVAELLQLLSQGGATVRVACSEHGAVFIEQPQHDRAPPVYYSDRDDYEQVRSRRVPLVLVCFFTAPMDEHSYTFRSGINRQAPHAGVDET